MSAADKLARLGTVLAEHEKWDIAEKEPHYWAARCQCGECVALHRQHVAAVVLAHLTAEGWAQGHEEWGVRIKLSPIRSTTQRHKTEESARAEVAESMRPDLLTLVRRRVTDWEPVDA